MSESNHNRSEPGLDEVIEAYEKAQARDGHADLAAFLPRPDQPGYLTILCELVRVDMEYSWRRDRPNRLEAYEARFPVLFRDPIRAREVAFEEYRLRQQAGDPPSPSEYRLRFGGDSADWPMPQIDPADLGLEDEGDSTNDDSRDVSWNSSEELGFALRSPKTTREQREVLHDLRRVDPTAADRLARGMIRLPEAGGRFLGFHLRRELGRGAFGRVFLADQEQMAGRPVALKITADALGETNALAQLQHTNVVPIYSVHRDGALQALCMPYFGSTTLADVIAGLDGGRKLPSSGRGLLSTLDDHKTREHARSTFRESTDPMMHSAAPPSLSSTPSDGAAPTESRPTAQIEHLRRSNYVDAVLWLGLHLADGLAHAHERGILHRDLKPANVLFTDDGEPMLLDFNLAADLKLHVHASAAMVGGTLPYMALEHLEAFQGVPRAIDARSDLFSLGVILFELLSGRHPFEVRRGPTREILPRMIEDRRGPLPDLRSRNRAVSPAVEAIVRRCLDPDPARRYQEARHLVEDLQRQVDHLPLLHTREPSVRERVGKWARRHPRLTSTTTVALASLALIAALIGGLRNRQHRLERLDASESLTRLGSDVRKAEFLLSSPDGPQRRIEEGLALCREAAGSYRAASDLDWKARPLVAALSETDRDRLSRSLGELLGLWAQGEAWRAEVAEPKEKTERIARAEGLLDRAEAIFGPGSVPAVLTLIRADLARIEGRAKEALRLRDVATAAPLRTARERLLLVPNRLDHGLDREALSLAEEASRLDPLDASAWLIRGYCLSRLSRPTLSAECYSVGIGLQPGFDWAYFDRGVMALESRDYPRAIEDFTRALALQPDLFEALPNRALAKLGLGDAAGAVADLDLALLRPETPTRAFFIRARAHEALGHADLAARDRLQGKRRKPADEVSWVTRGLSRLPDDPAGAILDFEAALKLNPRSFWALQNKASVLSESLGRTEEAVRTLDEAVSRHPESVPALAGRGVLLARLGRRDVALRDAKACLALDASADTLYRVACIYALASKITPDDRGEALRLLSLAVRQDASWLRQVPTDPDLDPLRDRPEFRRLIEALAVVCANSAG
ncbi:MAG: tetratricopeptide repeat protein [Planctomycetota bacterium]|nr:tetratricopeptide repeat protein [Planctomycetota bacterium]